MHLQSAASKKNLAAARLTVWVLIAALWPGRAFAINWANPNTNGFYHVGSNWVGGSAPGPADHAEFLSLGNVDVGWSSSTGNTTSNTLKITHSDIRFFSTTGRKHTTIGDATVGGATGALMLGGSGDPLDLIVGNRLTVVDGARFDVRDGSAVNADGLQVGSGAGTTSSATFYDSSSLTVTGDTYLGLSGATGSLEIDTGTHTLAGALFIAQSAVANSGGDFTVTDADVSVGNVMVGAGGVSGQVGTFVAGPDADITQTGASTVTVGAAGGSTGTFTTFAGEFTSGTGIITVKPTGTLRVDAFSTFNANGDMVIDGGLLDVHEFGILDFAPGKDLTVSSGGEATIDGFHVVNGGSATTIDSGSNFELSGVINVGFLSNGMLLVDGAGTTVSTGSYYASSHDWGRSSGDATVIFRNGADVTLRGEDEFGYGIRLADDGNAGSMATVSVESGATVVGDTLELRLATGSAGTAAMTITGVGSSVVLSGSPGEQSLIVGGTGTSDGDLSILNGGLFRNDVSGVTVNPTGSIVVDDGTLDTQGTLEVKSGGSVSLAGSAVVEADVIDVSAGGSYSDGAHATTRANTLVGFGDTVSFGGSLELGIDNGGGVGSHAVTSGQTFEVNGYMLIGGDSTATSAELIVNGGQLNVFEYLDVASEYGFAEGGDGTLRIINGGVVNVTRLSDYGGGNGGVAAATVVVTGGGSQLNVHSTVRLNVGTLDVTHNADMNVFSTIQLGVDGAIDVNTGGMMVIGTGAPTGSGGMVEVTANGWLTGNGTVKTDFGVVNSGGTVAPGLIHGTLTVNGTYAQTGNTDATLEIDISRPGVAGTDYDRLVVNGLVFPRATLDLLLSYGYTPALGDEFDFLIATGAIVGAFDTITNVVQPGGLGLAVRYGHDPGQVDMRVSLIGDVDFDDDVDTGDLTSAIGNFNGANGTGKTWVTGDFDGDGDTDTGDLTTAIVNFTGASAGNANVPDLVYDPVTGSVTIDADGADVISFSLQAGPFNAADFSELPAGLTDNIGGQIGWTSFNLFSGLIGTADLGAILPAGLDLAQLEAALTTASYGLALSGGGGGGRLDIIIPEPASILLMGLGTLAPMRRRRAA